MNSLIVIFFSLLWCFFLVYHNTVNELGTKIILNFCSKLKN
ncbi:hypothetical protein HMPREF9497_02052 [Enterococcus faecalis TX4244]|nr:hypothetical protein HMPREF9515_02098 [Enterococcus faecalis TX0860]EFT91048.1 hypothetical protein HMPREF9497_02052 [Enterococcus faecalis TX4244]